MEYTQENLNRLSRNQADARRRLSVAMQDYNEAKREESMASEELSDFIHGYNKKLDAEKKKA